METESSLPCLQEQVFYPTFIHMYPLHMLTPCFFKIMFNIIFPSMFWSPK